MFTIITQEGSGSNCKKVARGIPVVSNLFSILCVVPAHVKLQQPELPTVRLLTFPIVAGSDVRVLSLREEAFLFPVFTIRYRFPVSHIAPRATLNINTRQTFILQLGIGLAVEKPLRRVSLHSGLDKRGVESAARNREAPRSRQLVRSSRGAWRASTHCLNTNGRLEGCAQVQASGRSDSLLKAGSRWLSLVAYATSPSPCCAGPEAFGALFFAWRLLGRLVRVRPRLSRGSLSPLPLPRPRAGANDQIQLYLYLTLLQNTYSAGTEEDVFQGHTLLSESPLSEELPSQRIHYSR
uniref:uncharacterized protein LOC118536529 n=1 Tax=Halichoerus grypus TaxID=9711 RepID=UPI001658E50D|nr:uncharacterized protein LOC118536529 [Halichoerus grypus]